MERMPFEDAVDIWRRHELGLAGDEAGSSARPGCLTFWDAEQWLLGEGEPWQWRHIALCPTCFLKVKRLAELAPEKARVLRPVSLWGRVGDALERLLGINRRAAFTGDDLGSNEERQAYQGLLDRLRGRVPPDESNKP